MFFLVDAPNKGTHRGYREHKGKEGTLVKERERERGKEREGKREREREREGKREGKKESEHRGQQRTLVKGYVVV